MASVTIPQLPFLTSLSGNEQLEVVYAGQSWRITTGQIVLLAEGIPAGAVTKTQIVLALIDTGNPSGANAYPLIVNATNSTGDDAASAQWISGASMMIGDALYLLIQTTMGWSGVQMLDFMALAAMKPL